MLLSRTLWLLLLGYGPITSSSQSWRLQLTSRIDPVFFLLLMCVYSLVPWAILRCVNFVLVSFGLICRSLFLILPSFCFVLSSRSPKHEARLAYPVLWYSCSPRTRHVPHGSFGPWKHLLARSGFVELVPVVVHFPQLMTTPCVHKNGMNS